MVGSAHGSPSDGSLFISRFSGDVRKVALLQLATSERAYLFQLSKCCVDDVFPPELKGMLGHLLAGALTGWCTLAGRLSSEGVVFTELLECADVMKAGVGIVQDRWKL